MALPRWFDRLVLRSSTRKRVDGLLLAVMAADKKARAVLLRRVEAALLLIKLYDRPRYNRVVRDLERVQVAVLARNAGYDNSTSACMLDTRYVLGDTTSLEDIAATIVHEATHARLMKRGIGYEEGLRSRVEKVCLRREFAFAARLPGGGPSPEDMEWRLQWCDADGSLTDEGLLKQWREGASGVARHFGVPRWLERLLLTAGTRRFKRLMRRHEPATRPGAGVASRR